MSADHSSAEVLESIKAVGTTDASMLIGAAVGFYDQQEDPDDILSSSQLRSIERLRSLACQDIITTDDLTRADPWDLINIMITAVELYDTHGEDQSVSQTDGEWIQISELASAIERARPLVIDE